MCHCRVAKSVSASRGGSSLAMLPPFAQLGQRIRAHSQTELTAEATQEPDWTDAAKWFDVLRFATRWAWRDRTTECCNPVLTHNASSWMRCNLAPSFESISVARGTWD